MRNRFHRLVVSTVLVLLGAGVASGADSAPALTPTATGWSVTGFEVGPSRGAFGRFETAPGRRSRVDLAAGERRYLLDDTGRPLGLLSGPTPSLRIDG